MEFNPSCAEARTSLENKVNPMAADVLVAEITKISTAMTLIIGKDNVLVLLES